MPPLSVCHRVVSFIGQRHMGFVAWHPRFGIDLFPLWVTCPFWLVGFTHLSFGTLVGGLKVFYRGSSNCSGKLMTIKLWINLTSIKPESPQCFYCFQRKREKYEQSPKIRSFQIKTNKIPNITGKGVGYTEGRC